MENENELVKVHFDLTAGRTAFQVLTSSPIPDSNTPSVSFSGTIVVSVVIARPPGNRGRNRLLSPASFTLERALVRRHLNG